MPRERACAFAPGRVNLIGEHTDYNHGLALPFAIAEGVTVLAEANGPGAVAEERGERGDLSGGELGEERVYVCARALGERDEFPLADPPRAEGWRAFVRGAVAELRAAGALSTSSDVRLEIGGDLEQGAGLSSSAALEVALCLALCRLDSVVSAAASHNAGDVVPEGALHDIGNRALHDVGDQGAHAYARARVTARKQTHPPRRKTLGRIEIARLCARVENEWVGAQTGLLDQLASLFGESDMALLIDFDALRRAGSENEPEPRPGASRAIQPVPLLLRGWRLVTLDSGERHANESSGYNERRAECARACELLGVESLRHADTGAVSRLPPPLERRARHVLEENERVLAAVAALRTEDLTELGALLNASHESLRDLYDVSTPAVEAAVDRLRRAGATGARVMGGGFGGSVLGLFAPDVQLPEGAREVRPGRGARLVDAAESSQ